MRISTMDLKFKSQGRIDLITSSTKLKPLSIPKGQRKS